MAKLYYDGQGVTKNLKKALKLALFAAKNGLVDAQYDVGRAYYYGDVGIIDYENALKFLRMASEQNQHSHGFTPLFNCQEWRSLRVRRGGEGSHRGIGRRRRWKKDRKRETRKEMTIIYSSKVSIKRSRDARRSVSSSVWQVKARGKVGEGRAAKLVTGEEMANILK